MGFVDPDKDTLTVALRKESVDRNEGIHYDNYNLHWSLSARRAWIEIDWASVITAMTSVALRKESVDRNCSVTLSLMGNLVALRKESVDRNFQVCTVTGRLFQSLSARRAWIEIC